MFYTIVVIPSAVQIVLYLASEVLFILAPLDMILEVFDNFLVSGVYTQVHPVYFLP